MKEYVGFEGCTSAFQRRGSFQAHRMKEYVGFEGNGTLMASVWVKPGSQDERVRGV